MYFIKSEKKLSCLTGTYRIQDLSKTIKDQLVQKQKSYIYSSLVLDELYNVKYCPINTLGTFCLKRLPNQKEKLSICSLQNQIHRIDFKTLSDMSKKNFHKVWKKVISVITAGAPAMLG